MYKVIKIDVDQLLSNAGQAYKDAEKKSSSESHSSLDYFNLTQVMGFYMSHAYDRDILSIHGGASNPEEFINGINDSADKYFKHFKAKDRDDKLYQLMLSNTNLKARMFLRLYEKLNFLKLLDPDDRYIVSGGFATAIAYYYLNGSFSLRSSDVDIYYHDTFPNLLEKTLEKNFNIISRPSVDSKEKIVKNFTVAEKPKDGKDNKKHYSVQHRIQLIESKDDLENVVDSFDLSICKAFIRNTSDGTYLHLHSDFMDTFNSGVIKVTELSDIIYKNLSHTISMERFLKYSGRLKDFYFMNLLSDLEKAEVNGSDTKELFVNLKSKMLEIYKQELLLLRNATEELSRTKLSLPETKSKMSDLTEELGRYNYLRFPLYYRLYSEEYILSEVDLVINKAKEDGHEYSRDSILDMLRYHNVCDVLAFLGAEEGYITGYANAAFRIGNSVWDFQRTELNRNIMLAMNIYDENLLFTLTEEYRDIFREVISKKFMIDMIYPFTMFQSILGGQ